MTTIVTRSGKGSVLTHNEMDTNLTNLNTDKFEKSGDSADYVDLVTTAAETSSEGRLFWDNSDNAGTLAVGMKGGDVTQQVGLETFIRIKATTAITNGQLVMRTGTVGTSGTVTGAPATGITLATQILGVATEDIPLNDFGYVTTFGIVRVVNTTGTAVGETWADGDSLYYNKDYPGGLTNTLPEAPTPKLRVGSVVYAGVAGTIGVRMTFGSSLGAMESDVQIDTLADMDMLMYQGANNRWENYTPSEVKEHLDLEVGTDIQAYMPTASQAEMEAGTEAALRAMSPELVSQAIAAQASSGGLEPITATIGNQTVLQTTYTPREVKVCCMTDSVVLVCFQYQLSTTYYWRAMAVRINPDTSVTIGAISDIINSSTGVYNMAVCRITDNCAIVVSYYMHALNIDLDTLSITIGPDYTSNPITATTANINLVRTSDTSFQIFYVASSTSVVRGIYAVNTSTLTITNTAYDSYSSLPITLNTIYQSCFACGESGAGLALVYTNTTINKITIQPTSIETITSVDSTISAGSYSGDTVHYAFSNTDGSRIYTAHTQGATGNSRRDGVFTITPWNSYYSTVSFGSTLQLPHILLYNYPENTNPYQQYTHRGDIFWAYFGWVQALLKVDVSTSEIKYTMYRFPETTSQRINAFVALTDTKLLRFNAAPLNLTMVEIDIT